MTFIKNKYLIFIFAIILFTTISSLVIFSNDKIFDYDSFYHLGHTKIYRTDGFFSSSFPWAQYSTINKYSSDIWYGFHLFLIPFSFFSPLFAIRLSSVFLAVFFLLSFFYILRSLNIKYPLFWSLLVFFSSGDFLFRINMSRPHILSLTLSLFIFYFLIKKNRLGIFFSALLLSFFHASLFWLSFFVAFFFFLTSLILKEKINWLDLSFLSLGSLIGIFLRPNPLGSLKLIYVQIVEIILVKKANLPLKFGRELYPIDFSDVYFQFIPLALIFILSSVLLFYLFKNLNQSQKISSLSAFLISFFFLLMSFFIARRSLTNFSVFSVLSLSLLSSFYFEKVSLNLKSKIFIYFFLFILLISSLGRSIYVVNLFLKNSDSAEKFKEVSLWLKENSKEGDIVFNSYWDNFPNLFFWNHKNYYRGGMDPIFQYSFNQNLFWKAYFIAYTGQPFTCGYIRCTEDMTEDIYDVLKNNFKASYVIVEKRRSPNLNKNLENLSKFENVFENNEEVLYKIN